MAILYGTTADGDSLPVEVNEFGQLVAQGLQGQEGPPGPPGVGQLPPNPFEGAILGWKDNTLSWLGGEVPLPAGTFGPIMTYENGVLGLATQVSLPYLSEVFLSDAAGNPYSFTPVSSPITNVSGNVLTLEDNKDLIDFRVGDIVQVNVSGAFLTGDGWPTVDAPFGDMTWAEFTADQSLPYGPVTGYQPFASSAGSMAFPFDAERDMQVGFLFGENEGTGQTVDVQGDVTNPGKQVVTGNTVGNPKSILIDLKKGSGVFFLQVDAGTVYCYGRSAFGSMDNVSRITEVDSSAPSLTVDSGVWNVGEVVTGPLKSGSGTVQSTVGDTIVLRANNDEWQIGQYVTSPEQTIAARYVFAEEQRLKKAQS